MTAVAVEPRARLDTLEEWQRWCAEAMEDMSVDATRTLSHRMDGGPSHCHACGWRGIPNRGDDGRVAHACPSCGHGADYREHFDMRVAARQGRPEPRRVVKVGRNEPCPCGSGSKFKRCCGR